MSKSQLAMYIENQAALLKEYNGQIIAVQDGKFLGAYPDKLAAYRDMKSRGLKDGQYIIVNCTPGDSAYTAYFANWFAFGETSAHA